MVRRVPLNARRAVREGRQERPESPQQMGHGVSWWLWKQVRRNEELWSRMLSRMLVLKKSLGRVQRGG